MKEKENIHFHQIKKAIAYIKDHFKEQPSLEKVAEQIHISPFHFQKLFTDWAGVSPKKFLQYITLEHAKKMLKENQASLFDTAFESGLSGTSRLHDLFVSIEGMTPGEYKNGGENLTINYSFAESPFGSLLVASTAKGICYIAFADDEKQALSELKLIFPNAVYKQMVDLIQQNALSIFSQDWKKIEQIKLHLKGTEFQLKVWETLLKIPMGELATYGKIASAIERPTASRAVGTAIGDNPVAFLIPCHRVIQSTGMIGQYHWGSARKTAMIGWEAARTDIQE
ncbi:methylated-DNA--protein-cysteine methyltransferase [Leptospira kobayashii]|uniref:Methylated-DNA--protein-cysteine methyltransferase n=1 Tax=Leptospira kobayashii TaxID=1917830 RepID=A0ABN6K890_9LEPT|nr:methylated-DNA--[protein]-cysteine S-methyltransferase [Leptospira kobayashii]BDA77173.1 methylated-DNA--protein-cysteine methyltransferase [Leptospira kobayashii]